MRPQFTRSLPLTTVGSLVFAVGSALGQSSSYDWTPATAIPDNNPIGIADTRNIDIGNARAVITGLEVRLNLTGTWNGDLYASLVHDSGFSVLLNRPGNTVSNPSGSASAGMNVTFSNSAATDIHTGIPNSGLITGTWQPDARAVDPSVVTDASPRTAFLSSFNESPLQGNWTIFLADNAASDTSTLAGWGLTITSENRDFAIWDANGNTTGIGGAGTWNSSSSTWATSNVGTSVSAHDTYAQLVFRGTGSAVTVSGTVGPEAGLDFETNGHTLSGGTIQLAGASVAANELKVANAVSATIGSVLSGMNGLTKSGTGELVLTGINTYTGTTNVNVGTLSLGHATNTLANSITVNVNGGILALGVNSDTVGSVTLASGSITGSGTLTAATYSLTGGTLAAKLGAGAVTVNGAVTFSAAGRLNASSSLLIQGGTLTLAGDETVASFQQTGGTIAGGFGINSAANFDLHAGTLSSKMSGAGGLKKRGGGKTTITGNNTYTGATDIIAGTLLVNGSTAAGSTVAVSAGATLGGTGTIGGAVNVSGVLSPGASIETLNTGTLSMVDGSALVHELNSSVATAVGSDLLLVTGDLNLAGTVGLTLSDLASPNVAFDMNDVFSIINYTGEWNGGLFTFEGNQLANAEKFIFGLNEWRIDYNAPTGGSNFASEYMSGSFVNLTVVPEPDVAALIGAFGAILLLRRRR